MTDIITSTQPLAVEHIVIYSPRSFHEVRRKLEDAVPVLSPGPGDAVHTGGDRRTSGFREAGQHPSIVLVRNQATPRHLTGQAHNALQYLIGNLPATLRRTRRARAGTPSTPLQVTLYEDDLGRGVFEYVRPSSLCGQADDERVMVSGHAFVQALERALLDAAG